MALPVQINRSNGVLEYWRVGFKKRALVIFSMLLCVAAFGVLGVLVAAPLVAIVHIVHDELYRKRFLPTVTDADLDRLSQMTLREKH